MALGLELHKLRKAKGLGLRELARKAEISPAFLSQVEAGNVTPPSREKLRRLAKVLGCEEDRLIVLSDRVPKDVMKIMQRHPCEYMALIRRLRRLSALELNRIHDDGDGRLRARQVR